MEKVTRLASEKGVVIFSKTSCCMCYSVKQFFLNLSVVPVVYELDQNVDGREMENALGRNGYNSSIPVVFIDGKIVGSTKEVMSLHLSGSLIPLIESYQKPM